MQMRAVVAAVAAATLAATQPTAWPAAALCLVWVAWRCISSVWRRARYLAQRHNDATGSAFFHVVVLFDGDCVLCNGFADFILRRSGLGASEHEPVRLRVARLGSASGQWLLRRHNLPPAPDTFVVIEDNRAYIKSEAALRVLSALKPRAGWVLMMLFAPVPLVLRDAVYNVGWTWRRHLFGTTTACPRRDPRVVLQGGVDEVDSATGSRLWPVQWATR